MIKIQYLLLFHVYYKTQKKPLQIATVLIL
jgi:hypothetical protein